MKSDFIKVSTENILKEGQTIISKYCDKKYVIYINKDSKIYINTYYTKKGNVLDLCTYYNRLLCNTIDEYEKLDLQYIESQAYGSYMDGAR